MSKEGEGRASASRELEPRSAYADAVEAEVEQLQAAQRAERVRVLNRLGERARLLHTQCSDQIGHWALNA